MIVDGKNVGWQTNLWITVVKKWSVLGTKLPVAKHGG